VIPGEVASWERDGTREKRKPGMREYVVGMVKYSKNFYVCCVVYILQSPPYI
jgi:hypothetical protein